MAAGSLSFLFFLLIKWCLADRPEDPSPEQYCVYACNQAVDYNTFAGTPNVTDSYYLGTCQNELYVSTMWVCARKHCTKKEIDAGYEWKSAFCLYYASVDVLSPNITSNLTDEDINSLPVLNFGNPDVVNITSLVNGTLYDSSYHTIAEWFNQVSHHKAYARAMFIFWAIVIGIGIVYNGFCHFGPSISLPQLTKAKGIFVTAPYTALQGDGSRASLLESLINAAFVVVNIVLCATNYVAFDGNIWYATGSLQIWRYLADRTGYIAYSNLSIIWFFGIRNNILIWLTGWSFARFSRFHRTVAFLATVEAVTHSIAHTVVEFYYGNAVYVADFQQLYWICGVVATVLMSFLVIFSIAWLRLRWYDLFLIVHIVFALVVLVMLYNHTAIFLGEFDGYLWPCVALWGFDRLVRVARVVWNVLTAKSSKCLIEYDQDADLVRIEATEALSRWGKSSKGSHFYMYLIKTLRFWESHPFTLVHWQAADEAGESLTWHCSFMIRPYDGFTRTLAKQALRTPVARTCLFEGPYGEEPSLHRMHALSAFNEVMYIMGGSGISVAISSIYSLLEKHDGSDNLRIKLIWAVRNHSFLATVLDRELRHAKGKIEIDAYITQSTTAIVQIEDGAEIKEKEIDLSAGDSGDDSSGTGPDLGFTYGRPDVQRYVLDAAKETRGTVGIVMCGPVSMMSDVSKAVVAANRDGIERVRLFAEDFSW